MQESKHIEKRSQGHKRKGKEEEDEEDEEEEEEAEEKQVNRQMQSDIVVMNIVK